MNVKFFNSMFISLYSLGYILYIGIFSMSWLNTFRKMDRFYEEHIIFTDSIATFPNFQNYMHPIPSSSEYQHDDVERRTIDFDARLRLTCVANDWQVPVYLFGRIQPHTMTQYVAVLLATDEDAVGDVQQRRRRRCALIMELQLTRTDLMSRAAEVTMSLVRHHGGLPPEHLVLAVGPNGYHVGECVLDAILSCP